MTARPDATLRVLEGTGITHVVGLPDNTTAPLFDALVDHPSVRLVTVSREGEAFAIASGLWLGGAWPLVAVQNTGFLESGDSVRGTVLRMSAPVPILVTGRGYATMRRAGLPPDEPRTPELLARHDVDSVALLTEPTMRAWGLPFELCEGDDDPAAALEARIRRTHAEEQPLVLLLARSLT